MRILKINKQLGNLLINMHYQQELEWIILICEHNITGLPFVAKCLIGPNAHDNIIKLAMFFQMDLAEQYARFMADNEEIIEVTVKDHLDTAVINVLLPPPIPLSSDENF